MKLLLQDHIALMCFNCLNTSNGIFYVQADLIVFPESQYIHMEITLNLKEKQVKVEKMSCSVSKASGLAVVDKCFHLELLLSQNSPQSQ